MGYTMVCKEIIQIILLLKNRERTTTTTTPIEERSLARLFFNPFNQALLDPCLPIP